VTPRLSDISGHDEPGPNPRHSQHLPRLWHRGILLGRLFSGLPWCLKLLPRIQWRNPVMFRGYVGSLLTTCCAACGADRAGVKPMPIHPGDHALWLWFTVRRNVANGAVAEGDRQAQAARLAR